jgi:hypothetical protein
LPTTDANAALDGMMLPFGGAEGAMPALVFESVEATRNKAAETPRKCPLPSGCLRATRFARAVVVIVTHVHVRGFRLRLRVIVEQRG